MTDIINISSIQVGLT